ncbi:MAG: hypothetical protein IJV37_03245 [Bacteroidales bacterium]|nr:hypothetical protein [Bacteroidales bacterium]
MKKLILILACALLSGLAVRAQQPQLSGLAAHLQTDRISLRYSCVLTQDTPVHLSGDLLVQGECYRARGNGMEIYCDGKTRWTVDPAAREVYIETAAGLEELLAWRDSLSELTLTDVRYSPLSEDLSPFRYDTSSLDADWIVTDLRL